LDNVVKSRIPALLAGIYVALVVLSIVPVFIGGDALSGVFGVVLALPWTVLLTRVVDAINPSAFDGITAGLVMIVIGGTINAAIIYFVSRWIVRRVQAR